MLSDSWLPIGELARRTGVNPVTLRAWERRYGLLVPERTPKGHRLYSEAHVARVEDILHWLERGASVGQVRELLDRQADTPPLLQGDWHDRCQRLIDAVANLAPRSLDQQLNQAMALYPALTLCEQLLLPLLDSLEQRWRNHIDARLEQALFHTWLRSKLGARVYHDTQSLEGPPILLVTDNDQPLDEHLWLCAWLLSSSGFAVQVLERPVGGKQLQQAVARLAPKALVLFLGARLEADKLLALQEIDIPKLLGGTTVSLHEARVQAQRIARLQLFDKPQGALRLLQQSR
ncbi:MerR family transcriptional regulator [Pseudomonas entomophila]|uniref:MerR family transcriptional regulator n=1 Tax=Pseudomonas entomophila TaxID=312306 RepID=UPI0023D8A6A1|nr:MerR family transcriptional regulator [Pseudomonas entomophila]MDF0730144.1 MerR family transcriptional regulator [Pseudomonas entomophila]